MTDQSFHAQVELRVRAGFGGLLVVTQDEPVALKKLRAAAKAADDKAVVMRWSTVSGVLRLVDDETHTKESLPRDLTDLLDALLKFRSDAPHVFALVSAMDYVANDAYLRRAVVEVVDHFRREGHTLVLLEHGEALPVALRDTLTAVRHPLPDVEDTEREVAGTLADVGMTAAGNVVEGLKGLSLSKQLDAIGLAVVEAARRGAKEIDATATRQFKEREIAKLDFLRVTTPARKFTELLGHDGLKDWLARRALGFSSAARSAGLAVPRGMVLCGPPGTGKSRFAEAVAAEWGTLYFEADMASLYSSLLGETEQNLARLIDVVERNAPCVLLVDEVERAVGTGGERDGGTAERVLGKLLTWSSTKTAPVFVIYTSNYPDRLPPALTRKGRVDGIFFLDLPTVEERAAVLAHYLGHGAVAHDVSSDEILSLARTMESWTPAEIEAAVAEARYLAFVDGGRAVRAADVAVEVARSVPVAVSQSAEVARMREWASRYASSTQRPEAAEVSSSSRRKVRA
jgi:AAA+ superfamily predicted ATPase